MTGDLIRLFKIHFTWKATVDSTIAGNLFS